mmetsp:Transcript_13324/g.25888  ORF Transcript_13324/g.25888 Transcript_13324/m.25888 type:complete len:493 (-) Transcript_13324:441-1919(-)
MVLGRRYRMGSLPSRPYSLLGEGLPVWQTYLQDGLSTVRRLHHEGRLLAATIRQPAASAPGCAQRQRRRAGQGAAAAARRRRRHPFRASTSNNDANSHNHGHNNGDGDGDGVQARERRHGKERGRQDERQGGRAAGSLRLDGQERRQEQQGARDAGGEGTGGGRSQLPSRARLPRLRRRQVTVRRLPQPDRHCEQQEQVLYHPAPRDGRHAQELLRVEQVGPRGRGARVPERASWADAPRGRQARLRVQVQGQDLELVGSERAVQPGRRQVHAHPSRLRERSRCCAEHQALLAAKIRTGSTSARFRGAHLRRLDDGGEHARDWLRPREDASGQATAAHDQAGVRGAAAALAPHRAWRIQQRRIQRRVGDRARRSGFRTRCFVSHARERDLLVRGDRAHQPLLLVHPPHFVRRQGRHARAAAAHQQHAHPQEQARDVRGAWQHRARVARDRRGRPRRPPDRRQVRAAQDEAQPRRQGLGPAQDAPTVHRQHTR